jgi:superfamily II DNA or RNA helicase
LTREEIYNKAIRELVRDKSLMVEFATGLGKSSLAVRLIEGFIAKRGSIKALIVVNSSALRTQWKERYIDNKGYGEVYVETKHEAYPKGVREFDLVIYDEADEYVLNPDYGKVYELVKGRYNLAMSAYFRPDAKDKLRSLGYSQGQIITRQEAEEWKLISPTVIHNVYLPLKDIEKARVDNHAAMMRQYDGILPEGMGNEKFKVYDESFNRWAVRSGMDLGSFIGTVKKYNEERLGRSNLTVLNPRKIAIAADIVNSYSLNRVITFGTSIPQMEGLKSLVGGEIYHSDLGSALYDMEGNLISEDVKSRKYLYKDTRWSIKELEAELGKPLESVVKSRRKDYIISKVRSGGVRILHSAKALSRGLDLPETNLGIRLSRTSSKEDTLQSVGRVRAEGIFIELCTESTHESRDLDKIQSGLGLGTIHKFTFKQYMEKIRDGETI